MKGEGRRNFSQMGELRWLPHLNCVASVLGGYMMNEQEIVVAPSRTLGVLLLICAGALIVIVVTFALNVHDAQVYQTVNAASHDPAFCGMTSREFMALPDALQKELRAQCNLDETTEIR
jgi:hypothetical protein